MNNLIARLRQETKNLTAVAASDLQQNSLYEIEFNGEKKAGYSLGVVGEASLSFYLTCNKPFVMSGEQAATAKFFPQPSM